MLQKLIGKMEAPRWAQLTLSCEDGQLLAYFESRSEDGGEPFTRQKAYAGSFIPPGAIGDLITWLGASNNMKVGIPTPILQAMLGKVAAPRWAQITLACTNGEVTSHFEARDGSNPNFVRSETYQGTLLPVAALKDIGTWCKQAYSHLQGTN